MYLHANFLNLEPLNPQRALNMAKPNISILMKVELCFQSSCTQSSPVNHPHSKTPFQHWLILTKEEEEEEEKILMLPMA